MSENSLLHPTGNELREFIIGKLDDKHSAWIEEHLGDCETCNDLLERETHDDAFIDLIRHAEDISPSRAKLHELDTAVSGVGDSHSENLFIAANDTKTDSPHVLPFHSNSQRYRIVRQLGKGGMGSVYLSQDQQLDRLVALKIPNLEYLQDPIWTERFYREARAMATLRHPNICPVYDVGCVGGTHYITMAYIEGESLNKMQRSYSNREAAKLIQKLALALEAAHERGVVHRDLKPANIMIDQAGEPVVMDFGLAMREEESDSKLSNSRTVLGTPCYMSPEQAEAEHDKIGAGTDVYSLGVILYELLCGKLPFEGPPGSVIGKIAFKSPEPPSKRKEGVDLALEAICLKAMSKQVEDRYATSSQFAAALGSYLEADVSTQRSVAKRTGALWLIPAVLLIGALLWTFFPDNNVPTSDSKVRDTSAKTGAAPSVAQTPFSSQQAGNLQKEWAKHLKIDAEYSNKVGLTFCLIPPGKFLMGSPASEFNRSDNETLHSVRLTQAYYMSKYEVTQDQFEQVMGYNPSCFQQAPGEAPVEQLSWYEAMSFCRKLTKIDTQAGVLPRDFQYTLPTEAEWEFACRAGSQSTTYAGKIDVLGDMNAPQLDPIAWYSGNSRVDYQDAYDSSDWENAQYKHDKAGTNPVGQKIGNAWGLHDMLGNVHEWCLDWYDYYPATTTETVDPQGPASGEKKVFRGGGWHSDVDHCRCARRKGFYINRHYYNAGFRVAAVQGRQSIWATDEEVANEIHTSAEYLFRQSDTEQAIDAIQVAINMNSQIPLYWSDRSLLLASLGKDKERYLSSCRAMLSQFGDNENSIECYRLVQALCLLPMNDEFAGHAARIIKPGRFQRNPDYEDGLCDRVWAMVEYRRGRFSEAMKAIKLYSLSDSSPLPPDVGFLKALTLHQLERQSEAVEVFHAAQKWLLNDDKNDPFCDDRKEIWRRVLIARLLHREAKALIEIDGSSTGSS